MLTYAHCANPLPCMVMEGLSDRAPQAPPWWLISCGVLELRIDTGSSDPPQPVREPVDCTELHNCPPFCSSVRRGFMSSLCQ
ncbi:LL-diaminopimelate aminotransferase 2 [Dissostichus eleginoides]|uniref:LL-diaminopimelate aminotransferase 2 n=1 Tax=Dissostichus eleginoides TaxID=100907 RepID=A0AAD9C5P9_DISEL|nr:LL-diaminopimelate aminotransferase 2 [Dissostichus eleginoides]